MAVTSPVRVLVVDDDPGARDVYRRVLEREGYDVQVAEGGAAAMEHMAAHPPDVLVLDVRMPGLDGFAVCRAVKHTPSTRFTPIVLITGDGSRENRLQGIDAGADDFLAKPVDSEELRARVRALVRVKRSIDDLAAGSGDPTRRA